MRNDQQFCRGEIITAYQTILKYLTLLKSFLLNALALVLTLQLLEASGAQVNQISDLKAILHQISDLVNCAGSPLDVLQNLLACD